MSKLIIDNQSELTDAEALAFVQSVIQKGRVGKEYPTVAFTGTRRRVIVQSSLNKASDRFFVVDQQVRGKRK